MGVGQASFTDFATSPLSYKGNPMDIGLAHGDVSETRVSRIGFNYAFGNFSNDYNNQNAISKFKSLTFSYSELFKVSFLSTQKLNVKMGGHFNVTTNFRTNEELLNSSEGLDIIGTLFGSVNTCFSLNTNKKELFFNADLGLMNGSYRNGFAYVNQGAILNNDDFFDGYLRSIFSGYRISSNIGYTSYLKNYNAIRISYLWDAYRTSNDTNKYQMVYHTLKLSFLFNLK